MTKTEESFCLFLSFVAVLLLYESMKSWIWIESVQIQFYVRFKWIELELKFYLNLRIRSRRCICIQARLINNYSYYSLIIFVLLIFWQFILYRVSLSSSLIIVYQLSELNFNLYSTCINQIHWSRDLVTLKLISSIITFSRRIIFLN